MFGNAYSVDLYSPWTKNPWTFFPLVADFSVAVFSVDLLTVDLLTTVDDWRTLSPTDRVRSAWLSLASFVWLLKVEEGDCTVHDSGL